MLFDSETELPLARKELLKLQETLIGEGRAERFDGSVTLHLSDDPRTNTLLSIDAIQSAAKKLSSLSKSERTAVELMLNHQLASSVDEAIDQSFKYFRTVFRQCSHLSGNLPNTHPFVPVFLDHFYISSSQHMPLLSNRVQHSQININHVL